MSFFGLSAADWDASKRQLRDAILRHAWRREMTWYGEIAPEVTLVSVEPFSELMNHLLGAIVDDDHMNGLPLLTSIVTHKYGDKEPGDGFYEKAKALGYRFTIPFEFWSSQVQEVFTRYGRPGRS